jgi:hypothetical protein
MAGERQVPAPVEDMDRRRRAARDDDEVGEGVRGRAG